MSRCGRLALIVALALLVIPVSFAQQKKRVAVMDFDYGTVKTAVAGIWGTDQDVGKGISDLLVTKLVQDGKYSVIERNALDKILKEQNFANSDRADSTSAAKIGKILGVDAIIIGSITKFGRDDKNTTVGGGGFGGVTGKFGLGGVQKRDAKAVCGISARLIDTTTAEILVAVNGDGISKRSGASLVGAGGSSGGAGGGAFDMSNKNFGETILGEAVMQAVDSVGTQLDDRAANLPTVKATYSGLVADASGGTLILNIGSQNGVRVGDKIEISRQVRTVKDPATGKVLKVITDKIGDATVTEVDAGSATATFSGSGAPKVGDVAKSE